MWDKDVERPFEEWDSSMQTCKDATSEPLGEATMAYTDNGKGTFPSQLTLCPCETLPN